jgi:7,8-dihydro-6-hydroxymethylpterin dimethyltransferase
MAAVAANSGKKITQPFHVALYKASTVMSPTLSPAQIREWTPYQLVADGLTPLERTRRRVEAAGQWAPWQLLGRRMAVGCVALEITQRCNLDCSYCYLSESSEALKDIPLDEVYRRIDMIHQHYGPGVDVQVSGGDPTLRKRDELIAIIRYIKSKGLRSSLFTNGIKATRDLLQALCNAGLEDVAFHVDLTQQRKGYLSEHQLNSVRQEYIERVRGLPLHVIFNTTVFPGNFDEIPDLVGFFVRNADVVRFASFQVGANIGRGTQSTPVTVNSASVKAAIKQGSGTDLNFEAIGTGHVDCNSYAFGLLINGQVMDFFDDPGFVRRVLAGSSHLAIDRADKGRLLRTTIVHLLAHPLILAGVIKRCVRLAWRERQHLIAARGRVGKISFFVHSFMDAGALDRQRCEACSFMVMTPEGPLSMCVHNAKRDDYLLVPSKVIRDHRLLYFNPVTGRTGERSPVPIKVTLTKKTARGRARVALEE